MDLQLKGKRAFVSGSTQGIGYAIAQALAGEGATVVINGRTHAGVERALEKLRTEVPDAAVSGIAADFEQSDQVLQLLAALGDLDILVNNVGLFELKPFEDISDGDWQRYFDVNVMSGARLSRQALKSMLAKGWGRIIFVGSESGVNVPADHDSLRRDQSRDARAEQWPRQTHARYRSHGEFQFSVARRIPTASLKPSSRFRKLRE